MADYAEALNQHQALEFANKFISCLEDEVSEGLPL